MRFSRSHFTTLVASLSIGGYPLVASLSAAAGLATAGFSIAMRALVLASALLVITMYLIRGVKLPRFGSVLLITLGIFGVRLANVTLLDPGSLGNTPSFYWTWFLGVTAIPLVAIMLDPAIKFNHVFMVLTACLAISALMGLVHGTTGVDIGTEIVETGRAALEGLNPISLGNIGASLVLLSTWRLSNGARLSTAGRAGYLICVVGGLYISIVASSRSPFVSLIVVLAIYFFTLPVRTKLVNALVGITLIVGFAIIVVQGDGFLMGTNLLSRFQSVEAGSDPSALIRLELYRESLELIAKHPWLGLTFEVPSYRFYPHNFFIEYFMAVGLLFGMASVAAIIIVIKVGYRLLESRDPAAWIYLIFLQNLVVAMFSGAVYSNSALWVSAGLTLSAGHLCKQRSKAHRLQNL